MAIQKITSGIIADGAIVATDIADGTVTGPKLGQNAVSSNNIVSVSNTAIAGTLTSSQVGASVYEGIGFRNRIINGDMRIDQRNAGAAVTGNNDVYTLDRWKCNASQSSKFTVQQVTDAPSGFISSLKATSSSAYTVGAAENFGMRQILEGYSIEDWDWPNAGGKTVTLSFWVKSSLTGTFGGSVFSSSDNYVFSYSVSSANTWEYKTVTIAAPTSGTWSTGNSGSASIFWSLGTGVDRQQTAGSWYYSNARRSVTSEVQIVANNAATWQITGVQLEVGSVATEFERRPYGTELALCQRYCMVYSGAAAFNGSGYARFPLFGNSTNNGLWYATFPVQMRTTPTLITNNFADGQVEVFNYSASASATLSSVNLAEGSPYATQVAFVVTSNLSSGSVASWRWTGQPNAYIGFSAEL